MTAHNNKRSPMFCLTVLALTLCLLAGCGAKKSADITSLEQPDEPGREIGISNDDTLAASALAEYSEYSDLSGKKVSMLTGAPFEELVRSKVPDVGEFSFFNNTPDMILALKSGKTDAFLTNNAVAALAVNRARDPRWVEFNGRTVEIPGESAVWLEDAK